MTYLLLCIPKTGGTTFTAMMRRYVPGSHYAVPMGAGVDVDEANRDFDPAWAAGYTSVSGHYDFAVCARSPALVPMTVLRDPVDRVVSAYQHVLSHDDPGSADVADLIVRERLSVVDFAMHPRELAGSVQTLVLAGCFWSGAPVPGPEALLARAKENLRRCAYVGILERLSESATLLEATIPGTGPIDRIPACNVAPADARVAVDRRTRQEIEAHCTLDRELYDFGTALFERRLTEIPRTFAVVRLARRARRAPRRSLARLYRAVRPVARRS